MDPFIIISVISATSALVVSVLTHIKYSTCFGFNVRTRGGSDSPSTPLLQNVNPINVNPINVKPIQAS